MQTGSGITCTGAGCAFQLEHRSDTLGVDRGGLSEGAAVQDTGDDRPVEPVTRRGMVVEAAGTQANPGGSIRTNALKLLVRRLVLPEETKHVVDVTVQYDVGSRSLDIVLDIAVGQKGLQRFPPDITNR